MDIGKVVGAFVSGLATSPLVNALFPIAVSMVFTNSESLPFLTKWLFRALPFFLLLILFLMVIDSIESLMAGVLGLVFSIVVFGSIGIAGLVIMVAIFVVVAAKLSRRGSHLRKGLAGHKAE